MAKKLQVSEETPEQSNVAPQQSLTFDQWWMKVSTKHGLNKHLKKVLQKHFKAIGVWDKRDWDYGVKHFGWKV